MDIITMARELGKAIQQDERYLRIDAAKKANDEDKELQELIERFNMKRVELNMELSKEPQDKDKLMAVDKELKAAYQECMANPHMVEFNAAKAEVDRMMSFISDILYGSVNGENPDLIEENVGGCSGNCSACGGCH